jgi:hypothetical protein
MKIIVAICQVIVGCGLLNVWLLRFSRATAYRGATAGSMLEEFAAYGLPAWFCYVVGFLKVTSAICLLAGLLYLGSSFPRPSSSRLSWRGQSPCTSKFPIP